ncbi:MAG: hypothetical protein IAE65_00740 [Ignavibacteria bacterium]|nr:hypothetical protein [Ignavibacteria bacterium]
MPTLQNHYTRVNHNLEFLSDICKIKKDYSDWKVTVCFYVAVHIINYHLTKKLNEHFVKHKRVDELINPYKRLSPAKIDQIYYEAYKKLYNLSRRSRYLSNDGNDKNQEEARITNEKHFRKSLNALDLLLDFFVNTLKEKIDPVELQTTNNLPNNLKYFKIINE